MKHPSAGNNNTNVKGGRKRGKGNKGILAKRIQERRERAYLRGGTRPSEKGA